MREPSINSGRLDLLSAIRSGAVAGVISTLIFMVVHDLLISDIWFSLLAMLIAGIVCGVGIGSSFSLVVERPTRRAWIQFNVIFLGLFAALALTSVLIYSPVTSAAILLAANEPPTELIRQAVPLIIGFVLLSTFLISRIYNRGFSSVLVLFATILILTIFLGLNVAVIGLVSVTVGTFYLIAEMFGLIAMLAAVFVATFLVLERRAWHGGDLEPGLA